MGGTSGACPQVAGVAGLVLARRPDFLSGTAYRHNGVDTTHLILQEVLTRSAVDIGAPGRDDQTGYGRVNAYRALLSVMRGDINNDIFIDSSDLAYLIDIVFYNQPAPFDFALGDVVCDGQVDATDVAYLIDHALFGGPAPDICFEYDY